MRTAIARRLGQSLAVLAGVYTATFALLFVLSGDPLTLMISRNATSVTLTPAEIAAERADLGLDQALWQQYLSPLWNALHGDLGTSFVSKQPVTDLIGHAIGPTLALGLAGLVLGTTVGLLIGALATLPRQQRLRELVMAIPPLGISIPAFAVGMVVINLFAFDLKLLPSSGSDGFDSLVLPAATLALPIAATVAQVFERSLRTELAQPYAEMAYAKGASRTRVIVRHALRNAAAPTVTAVGLTAGNLLGGAVVVETVFARDGLGRLLVNAVTDLDISVVQAIVMLSAVAFLTINLLVDLLYPLLDPRIAHREEVGS